VSIFNLINSFVKGKIRRLKTDKFDYIRYWDHRYDQGGTSGNGSYGELAIFKANIINSFIMEHKVNSIIEFGCGDGNNLSLYKIKKYLGLDVSEKSILIETVTKKTEKVSKIEVYTRIVVLFFYPYIPLLLEQNISRYLWSKQLYLACLLGRSKNSMFIFIYQLVTVFFVTVSIQKDHLNYKWVILYS